MAAITNGAASDLLLAEKNKLAEFGHIDLNRHWAYSLYKKDGICAKKIYNCQKKVFS